MMKHTFVEINVAADCEGKTTAWVVTDHTFEEMAEKVTGRGFGPYAVREVEKTFNEDTFEITEKVLRKKEGTL